MGIIKQTKANVATHHAQRAYDEGHTTLVIRMDVPRSTIEGHPISGLAEQIEAVEAVGWELKWLSFLSDGKGIATYRRKSHDDAAYRQGWADGTTAYQRQLQEQAAKSPPGG